MPKISFLGAGNMAAAMVEGLLAKHIAEPTDIRCLGGGGRTAAALAQRTGIVLAPSLDALLENTDTLVLACKPQHLAGLDPRLSELSRGALVISVLAGKRLARLAQVFPHARNLVRAMPNTPGQIGAGITGWCALHPLSSADRGMVEALLGALGQTVELGEEHLDAVTAVSGSGPAYVFEFAAALRDAGLAAGLPPEIAQRLSVETLLGAARLLARRAIEPETLRNQVTSPNGTTAAGLKQLEAHNFRAVIRATVLAAKARSEELSKDT